VNELIPWTRLESLIEPFYPKAGNGRHPYPLPVMFRIHCMQQWYNLSDPAMEDALYKITFMPLLLKRLVQPRIKQKHAIQRCTRLKKVNRGLEKNDNTLAMLFGISQCV